MSIGGIGGKTPYPLHLFDRPAVGVPGSGGQRADDAARQAESLAEKRRLDEGRRLEEERRAKEEKELRRLDAALLDGRLIDPADTRPPARGGIVDIEV